MTFFDSTADLVGQLNGNGQKGMLQVDAPPVENFWLRHCGRLRRLRRLLDDDDDAHDGSFCTRARGTMPARS